MEDLCEGISHLTISPRDAHTQEELTRFAHLMEELCVAMSRLSVRDDASQTYPKAASPTLGEVAKLVKQSAVECVYALGFLANIDVHTAVSSTRHQTTRENPSGRVRAAPTSSPNSRSRKE